jgi:two-component system, chemotaxis family, chemotaxis protein CheY
MENRLKGANGTLSFLLVDDFSFIRVMLRDILGSWFEARIDEAIDGDTAIDKIKNNHYDLITMDYSMPGCPGPTLVEIIRKKGLINEKSTAILAISVDKGGIFKELGVPVIQKPFDPEQLSSTAEKLLRDLGSI